MIVAVFLFTTLFFTSGHHLGTTGTIEEKENPMKNTLLDKGIITPSGEISKDKIIEINNVTEENTEESNEETE